LEKWQQNLAISGTVGEKKKRKENEKRGRAGLLLLLGRRRVLLTTRGGAVVGGWLAGLDSAQFGSLADLLLFF
jgi:hypothetical protein